MIVIVEYAVSRVSTVELNDLCVCWVWDNENENCSWGMCFVVNCYCYWGSCFLLIQSYVDLKVSVWERTGNIASHLGLKAMCLCAKLLGKPVCGLQTSIGNLLATFTRANFHIFYVIIIYYCYSDSSLLSCRYTPRDLEYYCLIFIYMHFYEFGNNKRNQWKRKHKLGTSWG